MSPTRRVAASLIGHLASAINGSALARKTSFLKDRLGARIFGPGISIIDDPLRRRGLRSQPFDAEGVATMRRALVADRRYRTVLAITPDRARLRLPVRVTRIPQGSGHLGVRMHRAFRRFPRCRVALIGSDIPDAAPTDVWAAFRALGSAQAVFGPAADGGWEFLVGEPPEMTTAHTPWFLPHADVCVRARVARHSRVTNAIACSSAGSAFF